MSNAAQLHIVSEFGTLKLYTHWHGHLVPQIAEQALKRIDRADRLTDHSYAVAIIVKEFIAQCGGTGEDLGVGIGEDGGSDYADRVVIDLVGGHIRHESINGQGGAIGCDFHNYYATCFGKWE